jgi:hypothetical protein
MIRSMAHYHERDAAEEAFASSADLANPPDRLEQLAVAQYHALMAIYEVGLDLASKMDDLYIATLGVGDAVNNQDLPKT